MGAGGSRMSDAGELVVEGFRFCNEADADLAREEEKKIQYIMGRLNYGEPQGVLTIYNKMIANRIFTTPVGSVFLNQIRDFLIDSKQIPEEDIMPIPVHTVFSSTLEDEPVKPRRITPPKIKTFEKEYNFSKVMIALLVALVFGMFYITLHADNPNILNYKKAIENQYSTWEEDLSNREAVIRQKELELHIQE